MFFRFVQFVFFDSCRSLVICLFGDISWNRWPPLKVLPDLLIKDSICFKLYLTAARLLRLLTTGFSFEVLQNLRAVCQKTNQGSILCIPFIYHSTYHMLTYIFVCAYVRTSCACWCFLLFAGLACLPVFPAKHIRWYQKDGKNDFDMPKVLAVLYSALLIC